MKSQFGGKILVRVAPQLHEILWQRAQALGLSLNQVCSQLLSSPSTMSGVILGQVHQRDYLQQPVISSAVGLLSSHFGPNLVGIILFGSFARGEQSEASDVDLMVIVKKSIELDRTLYRKVENKLRQENLGKISIQITHLPESEENLSNLWYEVALEGIPIFVQDPSLFKTLLWVRKMMFDERVERRWSHGHPYWRKVA